MFDLENEVQGHRVHHAKQSQPVTNINLHWSYTSIFLVSPHRFEIFTFQNMWPRKRRSRSGCKTFAVMSFDGEYLTSYLMSIAMFAFFQPLHVKITTWKFNLENADQKHGTKQSKWLHSMTNIHLFKNHYCEFSQTLSFLEKFTFQNSWCITLIVAVFSGKRTPNFRIWWQWSCLLYISPFTRYSQIK